MATANWNDLPEDLFASGRRGSTRSSRSSRSPRLSPQPMNSYSSDRAPPRRKSSLLQFGRGSQFEPKQPPMSQSLAPQYDGFLPPATEQIIYPLREMADRVGMQVEHFAEQLDKFRPTAAELGSQQACREAALKLVNSYKEIAASTVESLRTSHGSIRRRKVQEECIDRLEDSSVGGDRASRYGLSPGEDSKENIIGLYDLESWEQEYNTWSLLEGLLEVRHPANIRSQLSTTLPVISSNDRFTGDGEAWLDFLRSDSKAKEMLLVIKWLEITKNASYGELEAIQERLETTSGRGKGLWQQGWLETRERLKGEKRMRVWNKPITSNALSIQGSSHTENIVTQLDPDAMTRQGRSLENADEDLESASWLICYMMLRQGSSMAEIRAWCIDNEQYSQALTISAGDSDGDGHQGRHANVRSRFQWRAACSQLAQSGGINRYERAVAGLLSGESSSSSKVCKTWDDALYAAYNHFLISRYKSYLHEHLSDQVPSSMDFAVAGEWFTCDDLASEVNYRNFLSVFQGKQEQLTGGGDTFKLIQASMIRGDADFGEFAFQQGVGLARKCQAPRSRQEESLTQLIGSQTLEEFPEDGGQALVVDNMYALRVLVHIFLLFKMLGIGSSTEAEQSVADNVIISYINFLLLAGKLELIPLYASLLPEDESSGIMARVLPSITNPEERMNYTRLMANQGIDVLESLIRQYGLALRCNEEASEQDVAFKKLELLEGTDRSKWPGVRIRSRASGELRVDEEKVIQSMEWFEYVNGCWSQTFEALQRTALQFLLSGRLDAAVELVSRMPPSRISRMKSEALIDVQVDILEHDESRSEELSVLCEALRGQARPYYEIGSLVEALQQLWSWRATEEELDAAEMTLEAEIKEERLKKSLDDLQFSMEAVLDDMLTAPSLAADSENQQLAQAQKDELELFERVRQAYIPEMVLGYVTALCSAASSLSRTYLLKALEVGETVAKHEALGRSFTATGRMGELVEVLALVSKEVLREASHRKSKGGGKMSRETAGEKKKLALWDINIKA